MPYENVIALVLIILVLLVPLLKWAKDKWMSKTIEVLIGDKPYFLSADSLLDLKESLAQQMKCDPLEAYERLMENYTGLKETLVRESRWIALSQLLRATPAEFMAWAIRHEHWGAVELFLNDPSITVRQLEDVLKLDLPVTLRESVERRRQHLSDRAV